MLPPLSLALLPTNSLLYIYKLLTFDIYIQLPLNIAKLSIKIEFKRFTFVTLLIYNDPPDNKAEFEMN
jgi:hypothetical protein